MQNPHPEVQQKSLVAPPPIDWDQLKSAQQGVRRNSHTLFLDTRDADVPLLNSALGMLQRRAVKFQLVTVGPADGLDEGLPRRTVAESDEAGQMQALYEAGVHVSARRGAASDIHAVRALKAGCWPILPRSGVYPELLPQALHPFCLYDGASADVLANRLHNVWMMEQPRGYEQELDGILSKFDALQACRMMDDRLAALVH